MAEEKFCACPYCEAVFRLPEEKFNQLSGMVRCGACREIFDASANLVRRSIHGFVAVSNDELNQPIHSDFDNQPLSEVEDPQATNPEVTNPETPHPETTDPEAPGLETTDPGTTNPTAIASFQSSQNPAPVDPEISAEITIGGEPQSNDQGGISEKILSIEIPCKDEALFAADEHSDYPEAPLNVDMAFTSEDVGPDHARLDDVLLQEFEQSSDTTNPYPRNPFEDSTQPVADEVQTDEPFEPVIEALDFDPEESINLGMHSELDEDSGMSDGIEPLIYHDEQSLQSEPSELTGGIDLSDLGELPGINPPDTLNTPTLSTGLQDTPLGRMSRSGVDHYINDRTNPFVSFSWMLVTLVFVFLFGMQIKYFFVERYAQHESYRPYLVGFCKIARCQLAPRQDPFRFTLTHTKIDLHPSQPGALRVTVKLVNEAKFAQPYPLLQLTLTDRVGRVVGRRTFTPESYLVNNQPNMLGQGELASLLFDLARPHEKAVGFVVDIVTDPISS